MSSAAFKQDQEVGEREESGLALAMPGPGPGSWARSFEGWASCRRACCRCPRCAVGWALAPSVMVEIARIWPLVPTHSALEQRIEIATGAKEDSEAP
jgi:hypothetical protein